MNREAGSRTGAGASVSGAVQSWAQGSLGAIVYMLARCTVKYGVVDELADELGLVRKSETEKAKVALYILERLRCTCQPHAPQNLSIVFTSLP